METVALAEAVNLPLYGAVFVCAWRWWLGWKIALTLGVFVVWPICAFNAGAEIVGDTFPDTNPVASAAVPLFVFGIVVTYGIYVAAGMVASIGGWLMRVWSDRRKRRILPDSGAIPEAR